MKKILLASMLLIQIGCESKKHILEYDERGFIKNEGYIIEGLKQGKWISYDAEGDTTFIEFYNSNSLTMKLEYHNNILWKKTEYKYKKKNGNIIIYYANGQVECEGKMIDDVPIGKHICYREDGGTDRIIDYNDGVTFGGFTQYYPNGKINVYSKELGNGLHEIYDTMGVLTYKIMFENYQPKDTLPPR